MRVLYAKSISYRMSVPARFWSYALAQNEKEQQYLIDNDYVYVTWYTPYLSAEMNENDNGRP